METYLHETLNAWSGAALLLLLALLLAWRPVRLLRQARRHQRLISGCGVARLDNVILEDGLGGHKVLEHLLLTPQGLLVLLPRNCEGALFGGEKIESWTQMVRGKSYHFENPLHQVDELLNTLRYHLPGIPIEGRVLFCGSCRFPKGRPGRILLLEEMNGTVGRVEQAVVPVLEEAWQQLQRQPRAAAVAANPLSLLLRSSLWLALSLLLMATAWLVWRLELV